MKVISLDRDRLTKENSAKLLLERNTIRIYHSDPSVFHSFSFDGSLPKTYNLQKFVEFLNSHSRFSNKVISTSHLGWINDYLADLPGYYLFTGASKTRCYHLFKSLGLIDSESDFFTVVSKEVMKGLKEKPSGSGLYYIDNLKGSKLSLCRND